MRRPVNYYLSVKHRKTIETWGAGTINYTSGGSVNYSFISSASLAFGSNMKQVDLSPVRYAIYSGNQYQNGYVNLRDVVNVSNNASVFANGYLASDMNGDNTTDLSDLVLTANNASAFVAKIVP